MFDELDSVADLRQRRAGEDCTMHTATRGPGRRKQHYSQATFNMHLEAVTTDRRTTVTAHTAAANNNNKQDRSITLEGDDDGDDDDSDDNDVD